MGKVLFSNWKTIVNSIDESGVNCSRFAYKPKNQVFYGVFDESATLRAFKITAIIYGAYGFIQAFRLKIAGLDEEMWVDAPYLYLYQSKEDYLMSRTCNYMVAMEADENGAGYDYISNVIAKHFPYLDIRYNNNCMKMYRWGWINNKPMATTPKYCIVYDVATDDYTLRYMCDPSELVRFAYYTMEDAIKDNELDVCEFGDENDGENYEVTIEVIKSVTTSVKAKDSDSVLQSAKTAFDGVDNYKVYINGKLAYQK